MTRRVDVIWVVLAVAATIVGVWLGVAGAELSPITTQAPLLGGGPGR